MAFRTNTAAAQTYTTTNNIPEDKKAIGYINMYLPTANGKGKLVGIPVVPSKDGHQDLHDWLMEDLENNPKKMLEAIIVNYVPVVATQPGTKKFILG